MYRAEVLMKHVTAMGIVALAVLASPGTLRAHHSLVQFDTTTPLFIKGTVVRFDRTNPHSRIFVEQRNADGQMQRWAVEGPAPNALARMGIDDNFLKSGDVIAVCGFALKAEGPFRSAPPAPGSPQPVLAARAFSGHLLVLPDGERWFWSDYGVLDKCLRPGETKESLSRSVFGSSSIGRGSER
jgi:hypothetical protein